MKVYSLEGTWSVKLQDGSCHAMQLPGTLDENGIGYRDTGSNQWHPAEGLGDAGEAFDADAPIATRYTRKYTYEGPAYMTRRVTWQSAPGKRVFLEAERARVLGLRIDGREVADFVPPSISTPHIFEVTGLLGGDSEVTLISDNSYPGLPHDAIVFSSAATDETQTNWNGVLGYVRLREEEPVFLHAVRVYPKGGTLTVKAEISADRAYEGTLAVCSEALAGLASVRVALQPGMTEVTLEGLALRDDVRRWDEYEGNLYELTASLENYGGKTVRFGVRDFGDNGSGRLAVNGRTIFLRSEANCAEFPEEGHPPMSTEEWRVILSLYKSYGINCMRFHSHCPPEAAFDAADELGMLMQPELSHWNPRTAFEDDESYRYFRTELEAIVRALANHPSFVMLTFGNELCNHELGLARMHELLDLAHELDATRLYANASNGFYGRAGCDAPSDFYTSQKYDSWDLRGTFAAMEGDNGIQGYINQRYPSAVTNYDASMAELRKTYKKPVFSFEVGQFEVLPDFEELADFHGVSLPVNLELIREKAGRLGLLGEWKRYVEATGELSRIGYREEIEAAMRTKELSGISLLGLQDFPGQGTALVGMINSHMKTKPYAFARPEKFRRFFRSELALVGLPRYTYEAGETLMAEVTVANYGKQEICAPVRWTLWQDGEAVQEGVLAGGETVVQSKELQADETGVQSGGSAEVVCPAGTLTKVGTLELPLDFVQENARFDLEVRVGIAENTYPLWVYRKAEPVCPANVHETAVLDETALGVLAGGGCVYLTPPSDAEHLPSSIRAQFTTDFWSVGTFAAQEGGMGQLIDERHPIFAAFPTEFHTNWQWWPMAVQRAVILPRPMKAIVTEMDSYAYMRPMAQLLECRCNGGRLLLSSMGLQDLQQYPEARALLRAIYGYLASDAFAPEQELTVDEVRGLVH